MGSKSKFDKTCTVCGEHYLYCSGCSDYAKYPRWMESFCSDNCRRVFKAEMDYRAGVKAIDQAKSELEHCDLSKKDNYPELLRTSIDTILAYKEEVKSEEKVDDDQGQPDADEVKAEEVVEEEKSEENDKADENKNDQPKQQNSHYPKNNKFNGYKKANFNR